MLHNALVIFPCSLFYFFLKAAYCFDGLPCYRYICFFFKMLHITLMISKAAYCFDDLHFYRYIFLRCCILI